MPESLAVEVGRMKEVVKKTESAVRILPGVEKKKEIMKGHKRRKVVILL